MELLSCRERAVRLAALALIVFGAMFTAEAFASQGAGNGAAAWGWFADVLGPPIVAVVESRTHVQGAGADLSSACRNSGAQRKSGLSPQQADASTNPSLMFNETTNLSHFHINDVHARAVNFIAPSEPYRHHDVFFHFVPAANHAPGDTSFVHDFLGMRTRRDTFCFDNMLSQSVAHAGRAQACNPRPWDFATPPQPPKLSYPLISEEYFEYIDLLTSVLRHPAPQTRPFTIVEVGCGFCYWTVSALLAAQQKFGSNALLRFRSLDASTEMIERCQQQLTDNGFELDIGAVILGAIVASPSISTVSFVNPGNYGGNVGGVSVEGPPGALNSWDVERKVPALTLSRFFEGLGGGIVDLLDVDIQGSETDAFTEEMEFLNQHVKLVHIGSHGTLHSANEPLFREGNEIERSVLKTFDAHKWVRRYIFPRTSMHCNPLKFALTEYGPICFADGVLSFENPRLAGK
jgi:hypothetical protein